MPEETHAVTCKGVKVPPSPFLTDTRIRRIAEARYEGEEIAGALSVVRPGDRVLEMGAGLGIVGAVTALNAKPAKVLSFEANPALIPHIQALYALNGLQDRIEVRNAVVVSAKDRPETMTFHVRNSFLGSSLMAQEGRQTRPVAVPTVAYDTLVEDFRPDVLILDIEGGEMEFLTHADLRGIRAVVIEFHPDRYGPQGAKVCKEALRLAGFLKRVNRSTRFVWTCVRPDWAADRRSSPPHPERGWSREIVTLKEAIAKPAEVPDLSAPSGVMSADGADVPEAAHWRKHRRVTLPFERPADVERLEGRWIFGGILYRNFAHFMAESLGRLWGMDASQGYLSGVVFLPRRARADAGLKSFHKGVFEAFGLDLPVKVLQRPTQVEELVVPGQGFGLGQISAGTEAFRTFTHRRFGAGVVPEGPARLYISRARLGPTRGALLGETVLEEHLRAEGYEIFYPEEHDIATQIARYKAARRIVASEGSALHVFAMVGRADQSVAMICRRRSSATALIERHLSHFTTRAPLVLDHLRGVWNHAETPRKRLAVGEPDLPALQAALAKAGFVSGARAWAPLPEPLLKKALGRRYARMVPDTA